LWILYKLYAGLAAACIIDTRLETKRSSSPDNDAARRRTRHKNVFDVFRLTGDVAAVV
jgi:hypothetical protein